MADNLVIDQSERLTGKQVGKIIEDFAAGNVQTYVKNQKYYEGKNVEIIEEGRRKDDEKIKPNNIIPLPFARRTINDLQGYAYKPGNVQYQFAEDANEASVEILQEIFDDNDEPLTSAEIFQDSTIKGEGAELLYYADEKVQFAKIPREQCIFQYENTVKENKLEWAIRFYKVVTVQSDGSDLITHYADVYNSERVDYYEWEEKGDIVVRNQQKQNARFDENAIQDFAISSVSSDDYKYIQSEPHPFLDVPLYPYRINSDKLGVFQASISIINKLDGFGSDSISNSIDQFNDTLLTLSKKIDKVTADKIKDLKIIDDLGGKEEGNFAEFLQRNLDIAATLESTKLFERWYYELTGVPNLNSDKFNVKSGIAIAYALVSFENLVTTIEIYFSKGLQHRLELIQNALKFLNSSYEEVEAVLTWNRNLPFDIRERVEVAMILKQSGLLSDESILKLFPSSIVENAIEEIEKKKQEDKEKVASMHDKQALLIEEPKVDEEDDA